jgi:hypothetical protein
VEFDSHERDPPPRCYEGTCETIIKIVEGLLEAKDGVQRLFWIKAPAGAGKTAIIQTIAERQARRGPGASTLFFSDAIGASRPDGDPSRFWLTIAYRLAVLEPAYLMYLREILEVDWRLVEKSMDHQFEAFLEVPFGRTPISRPSSSLIPILIDGLEHYSVQSTQERIVSRIKHFMERYPLAPLMWIIASRAEEYLSQLWDDAQLMEGSYNTYWIDVHAENARNDVRHFYKGQFEGIRKKHRLRDQPWPDGSDFESVLRLSSGFFSVASGVTWFVDQETPPKQLQIALDILTSSSPPLPAIHPLQFLFPVYAQILRDVPAKSRRTVRKLLGFFLLPKGFGRWRQPFVSFWTLCNLLDISEQEAYGSVSGLHSVLDVPSIENAFTTPLRLFHSSFGKYISMNVPTWLFPNEIPVTAQAAIEEWWMTHFRTLQRTRAPSMLITLSRAITPDA